MYLHQQEKGGAELWGAPTLGSARTHDTYISYMHTTGTRITHTHSHVHTFAHSHPGLPQPG